MENMASRMMGELLRAPAVATTTVTSSACNVSGYEGAEFFVVYGAAGDTLSGSVKMEAKLQECATEGGTYSDVGGTEVYGNSSNAFALADANTEAGKSYSLGYNGDENWVKVVVTFSGTHSNGTIVGIHAIKGMPRAQTTDRTVNP